MWIVPPEEKDEISDFTIIKADGRILALHERDPGLNFQPYRKTQHNKTNK